MSFGWLKKTGESMSNITPQQHALGTQKAKTKICMFFDTSTHTQQKSLFFLHLLAYAKRPDAPLPPIRLPPELPICEAGLAIAPPAEVPTRGTFPLLLFFKFSAACLSSASSRCSANDLSGIIFGLQRSSTMVLRSEKTRPDLGKTSGIGFALVGEVGSSVSPLGVLVFGGIFLYQYFLSLGTKCFEGDEIFFGWNIHKLINAHNLSVSKRGVYRLSISINIIYTDDTRWKRFFFSSFHKTVHFYFSLFFHLNGTHRLGYCF